MSMRNAPLYLLLLVITFTPVQLQAQDSTQVNNGRLALVLSGQSLAVAGTLVALNTVWYKNYEHSRFHIKNDLGVWCQVDKLGHAYTAYSFAGPLSHMYRWSGHNRKRAAVYGTLGSLAFLSVIEVLDGTSAEWGFSYGDMGANALGSALFLGQELAFERQVVQMKFSAHRGRYQPEYRYITDHLFGTSLPERVLKDYDAQTYWVSVDVHGMYKKWPRWLNLAAGYGAQDMYGAYYNSWKDAKGKYHDYNHVPRYRQIYLSLDLNLAAINTRWGLVNAFFDYLTIKIPAPTLEYNTRGKLIFHPVYF